MNFARLETSNATWRASQCLRYLRFKLLENITVPKGSGHDFPDNSGNLWIGAALGRGGVQLAELCAPRARFF